VILHLRFYTVTSYVANPVTYSMYINDIYVYIHIQMFVNAKLTFLNLTILIMCILLLYYS